jgi:hypothetical protein
MEVCKVEQHLYMKIAVLHGRNAWKCHVVPHEALDVMFYHIKQLQSEYRHSAVEGCQLSASTAMGIPHLHTNMSVAIIQQGMNENGHLL